MAGRWMRRVAGVAAAAALALGCASTQEKRQAEMQRVGEAAVDKAAYADELALFDQKQIAMAQLALERSEDPALRAFATQVAQDHAQHLQRLDAWAQAKAVELGMLDLGMQEGTGGAGMDEEAARAQEEQREQLAERADERIEELEGKADEARKDLRELEGKSPEEFDRAFLAQLAEDQKAGMELLERGRKDFRDDGGLTTLLSQTEPVLERHVKSAEELEKRLGS